MAGFTTPAVMANVSTWLESQSDEGIWADVDYSLGCDAREFLVIHRHRLAPPLTRMLCS
jgi:hypothetical protein